MTEGQVYVFVPKRVPALAQQGFAFPLHPQRLCVRENITDLYHFYLLVIQLKYRLFSRLFIYAWNI